MEYIFESLQYGIVPTLIVLTYLIVSRYLDSRKEIKKLEKEKEEAKRTVRINAEILDCFNELNSYLKHITKDIIDKEDDKCISTIRSTFKAFAYTLSKFATFTIISNNIHENKKNIVDNIENIVSSEFANVYSDLIYYHTEENPITNYIEDTWREMIVDDLKSIIFDEHSNKETRIYNVHNKMNIRINAFINSVTKQYINK